MIRHFFVFIIILFGLAACTTKSNSSQSMNIVIEDSDFDFGIIPDTIQILRHCFKIENKSSDSCHITKIEKSCGCTKVKISNNTIAPNSYILMDVEVDLGSNYNFFERDINIYTDMGTSPHTIFIRASRMMPNRIANKEFPVRISDKLRLNMPYVIIGNVHHGQLKAAFVNILNASKDKVHYTASIVDAPSYISIVHEEDIEPNGIGRIVINTDLSKVRNIWGLQRFSLLIKADKEEKVVPIEAIFTEDFSKEKTNARIFVPVTNYTIDTSSKTEVRFSIGNIGTDVLVIRNVNTNQQQVKTSLSSNKIRPKENAVLTVNIGKRQKDTVEIGITSNDSKEPYKIVRVFCQPL